MGENWFSTGYEKVQEVVELMEEVRNQTYIPLFFIKNDEEARVTFLTDKPVVFYEHFIKGTNRTFTCTQEVDCPLCASGNKASVKGAYLVIDHRHETWEDKKTKETKNRQYAVKLLKLGIRALQILERKNKKKGLLAYDWVITRTGTGNDTQYDFEDEEKISIPIPEADKLPNIVDAIKPKDKKYIMQELAKAGMGSGFNNAPINVGDEDEGVIKFN
jgi:hypothetical protein